jgi:hypothetical protein
MQMPPGCYLSDAWPSLTHSLDEALEFADLEEAEQCLATLSPQFKVFLRFRAACQAEADQRDRAELDGKQVW